MCFSKLLISEENVAFNKSAWQEHPAKNLEKLWAERAVDGMYSELSLYGGQCTISEYGHSTATWRVDLERVHNIDHIVVYFPYESKFFFPKVDRPINCFKSIRKLLWNFKHILKKKLVIEWWRNRYLIKYIHDHSFLFNFINIIIFYIDVYCTT